MTKEEIKAGFTGDKNSVGYIRYLVKHLGGFALEYICEDLPLNLQTHAQNVAMTVIAGKDPWDDADTLDVVTRAPSEINDDYPGLVVPQQMLKSQTEIMDIMERGEFK